MMLEEIQKNLDEVKLLSVRGGDGMRTLKLTVIESIQNQTSILMRLCKEFPEIKEERIRA